jgi:hypothetical protein
MELPGSWLLGLALLSGGVAAQEAGPPIPLDGSVLILESGEGERYWQRTTAIRPPAYPLGAVRKLASGCVNIGFTVKPDGTTDDFRVLKSATDAAPRRREAVIAKFAEASIKMIRKLHFVPGPENPARKPEFMAMSSQYAIGEGFTETCAIPDLREFLTAAATQGLGDT